MSWPVPRKRFPRRFTASLAAVMSLLILFAALSGVWALRQEKSLRIENSYDYSWMDTRLESAWFRLQIDMAAYAASGSSADRGRVVLREDIAASMMPPTESFPNRYADPAQRAICNRLAVTLAKVRDVIATVDGQVGAARAAGMLLPLNASVTELSSLAHLRQVRVIAQRNAAISRFERLRDLALLLSLACAGWLAIIMIWQNRSLVRSERAGRQAEQKMKLALDAAGAGWWERSTNGSFIGSSKSFEVMGCPGTTTTTSQHMIDLVHPDDRHLLHTTISALKVKDAEPLVLRYRVTPNGRGTRWVVSIGRPIFDGDQFLGAHGIIFDDTERHVMEEEIRTSRDIAERAVAAKSRMLAAASHDLRQPLQAMFMFTSALATEEDPGRRRETLAKLRLGMTTLRSLLNGIVEFARIDGEAITPQVSDFPIMRTLSEIEDYYAIRAARKGLLLRVVPDKALTVRTDPVLFGRMLRNLVENAIRYTERGSIEIKAADVDGVVVVSVSDTGIGISETHIELIWEEFHQVGNLERNRSQGLGLGLSIVRTLGRVLGHGVSVLSEPGKGSCFSISMPAGLAAEEAPDVGRESDVSPRRVVIVDDDRLVLDGLDIALSMMGFHVLAESCSERAIAAMPDNAFVDFIVADYRLGPETGVQVIDRIRKAIGRSVPALILTGDAADGAAADAALHDIEIFSKPISPEELARAIDTVAARFPS